MRCAGPGIPGPSAPPAYPPNIIQKPLWIGKPIIIRDLRGALSGTPPHRSGSKNQGFSSAPFALLHWAPHNAEERCHRLGEECLRSGPRPGRASSRRSAVEWSACAGLQNDTGAMLKAWVPHAGVVSRARAETSRAGVPVPQAGSAARRMS